MSVIDISPPADLSPKKKFFAEVGDECLNVDACIKLCQQIDTPQAKTIYRSFRKAYAAARLDPANILLTAEKVRENAFFAALADLGIKTTFTKISGTI